MRRSQICHTEASEALSEIVGLIIATHLNGNAEYEVTLLKHKLKNKLEFHCIPQAIWWTFGLKELLKAIGEIYIALNKDIQYYFASFLVQPGYCTGC